MPTVISVDSENSSEFRPFPKMARLNREVVVTEKIDGTNAQILIIPTTEMGLEHPHVIAWNGEFAMLAGSRNRWLTEKDDNYGFAKWTHANFAELLKLGPGRHFGEWWGAGIQRRYGLAEKRFSLFNVSRWTASPCGGVYSPDGYTPGPFCCSVVPTLWRGAFAAFDAAEHILNLKYNGSTAAPGFMQPEGIVVFHTAAGTTFKVTCENDESPKSLVLPVSAAPTVDEVWKAANDIAR